jgi:hypothetical protein
MAITQALGSSVATAGFGAADQRTRDRLPELPTVAEPARGPPHDPVCWSNRARTEYERPRRRSLWRNSTLIG